MAPPMVLFLSLLALTEATLGSGGDARLRLIDGRTRCSGRVEVWYNGIWGTVCNKGWGPEEAEVVCRQVGCGFGQALGRHSSIGSSSGSTWLVGLADCRGTESLLWHCLLMVQNPNHACSQQKAAWVICRDDPEGPEMSTGRWKQNFLESENISIKCSSRPFYNGSVFYLRKLGDSSSELSKLASNSASSVSFEIANATATHSGDYVCHYQIQRNGVRYNSTSSSLKITVEKKAPKPSIAADRWNSLYLKGETPVVYCWTAQFPVLAHYLYEGAENPVLWASTNDSRKRASFTIPTGNQSWKFTFWCTYEVQRLGRSINSTASDPLTVTVLEQPTKPTIRLKPASRDFEQNKVITCSVPNHFRENYFSLYKDGRKIYIRFELVSRKETSTKFSIANTNKSNSGNYTCRYQVQTSGRTYHSVESNSVELTIADANLRLVTGPDQCSGRVKIYYGGQWGRISSSMWDLATADVLCRHLGCGFAVSLFDSTQGSGRFWLIGAKCQGNEKLFWDCFLQPYDHRLHWNTKKDATAECSALPVKPTISLPRSPVIFVEGESFNIECLAPRYYNDMTFYLRKTSGDVIIATPPAFRASFAIIDANSTNGGSYVCWYQLKRDGRYHNSSVSESVNVTVGDAPGKPWITQDFPRQIFLAGESTIIKCIAPYLSSITGYFLYRNGEQNALQSRKTIGRSMSFLVHVGKGRGRFNYSCGYQVHISGRFFNSIVSNNLEIIVIDQLTTPELEAMPSPDSFVVNTSMSCVATNDFAGGMFTLYKEGREVPVDSIRDIKRSNRVTFSISRAKKSNQGNYTCRQQVEVDGRLYNSSRSNQLKLTITEKMKLRLVNGENNCSGMVEVFYNGEWRKICAPTWRPKEVNVICGQLGCGFLASQVASSHFGRGTGQILLSGVSCNGAEATLWHCFLRSTYSGSSCNRLREAVVNCSTSPKKPAILLNRPSGHFLEGEKIKIHCQALSFYAGSTFYLYKAGKGVETAKATGTKHSSQVVFTIINASIAVTGSYACAYQAVRFGATYNSTRSVSVDINVTVLAPKPRITTNVQRDLVFKGEKVSVECVEPKYLSSTQYYVKMHQDHVAKIIPSRLTGRGGLAPLEDLTVGARYNFTCMYQGRMRGRHFNSSWSDALLFTVTDRPPKPQISIAYQDHSTFQRHIRLTCRRPDPYSATAYYLHKDGRVEPVAIQTFHRERYHALFEVDNLNATTTGNYTCTYEIEWMGEKYTSEHSDPIGLSILGVRLRLSNGPNPCSGRVEVYYNQRWGSVCDMSLKSANAEVICKQLNCGFSNPVGRSSRMDGRREPTMLTGIDCNGRERSLWQCSLSLAPPHNRCSLWQTAIVNCTMKPEEPSIELKRPFAKFIERQSVTIRCMAKKYYAVSRFYLGKVDEPHFLSSWPASRTPHSGTFTIANASLSDAGSYTCLYEVERAGKKYNSTESRSLSVQISERPPPPFLSLQRKTVPQLTGSVVRLNCDTPFSWFASEIGLYSVVGDGYISLDSSNESSSRGIFTLRDLNATGNYSCRYSYQMQDRQIYSDFSGALTITVMDQLPKPHLVLDECMSSYPAPLYAKCSVSTSYTGGQFSLYEAGAENHTQTWKLRPYDHSTSYSFQVDKAANYTCQYSIVTSERVFKSPHSDPLLVYSDGSGNHEPGR